MKVSIITPFYNALSVLGMPWIERFCHNLAGQTGLKNFHRHIEHVWIDDGSSDATHDTLTAIAKMFARLNITILRNGLNEGPGIARNRAIQMASGKWIAYADSDDILADDREAHLRSIVATDMNMYFAPYYIREGGRSSVYDLQSLLSERRQALQTFVEAANPSIPLGVCHTKELWERAGGFPPNVVCGEDGILWRRMISRSGAKVGFLNSIAGIYIVRNDGQSRTLQPFGSGKAFVFDSQNPKGPNGQYLDELDARDSPPTLSPQP